MNKNNTAVRRILPLTLASLGALGGLQPAAADILLYDKDETTFPPTATSTPSTSTATSTARARPTIAASRG